MAKGLSALPEPSEHDQQCAIFQWAEKFEYQYPELWLLNGSLNGVRLTKSQAGKAKAAGMKRGYPDIFLPVARCGYNGLFIELKKEWGSYPTKDQKQWIRNLNKQGYFACVALGSDAARDLIEKYLNEQLKEKTA